MIKNLYEVKPQTVILCGKIKHNHIVFINFTVKKVTNKVREANGWGDTAIYECQGERYALPELSIRCLLEQMSPDFLALATDAEIVAIMKAFGCHDDAEAWKAMKEALIVAYDSSDTVKDLTINGIHGWLDKETRVGLVNMYQMYNTVATENDAIPPMWVSGVPIQFSNTEDALSFLGKVEMYSSQCYNITQRHLAAISSLFKMDDIDGIRSFEHRKDYPDKLQLSYS